MMSRWFRSSAPSFINLYGYGYQNIYELDGSYQMADPDIHWVSGSAPL
ncbi:hypothetical protein HY29_06415 [Hyphomonas beringensis]|uniref:Uncharacterized protein n=1 Tax=Hyphomonas beringensis TaxID=1280946 RepID=A0A062U2W8_9PROT|nr:hypothetical protein [Hyphomonas beringensis]KCZ50979.1 hypothetical protein HY29_06415 [Hyphomonas beringensis]